MSPDRLFLQNPGAEEENIARLATTVILSRTDKLPVELVEKRRSNLDGTIPAAMVSGSIRLKESL
jgi:hypothetical protein